MPVVSGSSPASCWRLMYGFVVLMDVAGFTEVLPLVVLPPVVLGLIAANSLLGGGRGHAPVAPPASPARCRRSARHRAAGEPADRSRDDPLP